jgi:hypothetical protein
VSDLQLVAGADIYFFSIKETPVISAGFGRPSISRIVGAAS